MSKAIIIARYNERLSWVNHFSKDVNIYIYNKGGAITCQLPKNAVVTPLPNVGREAHTYLHHLLHGPYHGRMVFVQGNPFDQMGDDFVDQAEDWMCGTDSFKLFGSVMTIERKEDCLLETGHVNGNKWSNKHQRRGTLENMADKLGAGDSWQFSAGAGFGVSAPLAMNTEMNTLRSLYDWCSSVDSDTKHEHSHVMERVWQLLFL